MKKGLGIRCIWDAREKARSGERQRETGFDFEEQTGEWRVLPERDDGLYYENWWGLAPPGSLPPELTRLDAHPFLSPHQLLPSRTFCQPLYSVNVLLVSQNCFVLADQ